MTGPDRATELAALAEPVRAAFEAAHQAREKGLSACRRTIRLASQVIRAVHRRQPDEVAARMAEVAAVMREAQAALAPHPEVAHAGFLHDAEKEYAEAVLLAALVSGSALPDPGAVGVGAAAWLRGLAEAASELRRHLLDRLRGGETAEAERLLTAMEDVYDLLVTIDYPDALTGGLRRTTDALRAVLERTRADLTVTLIQGRLQASLERVAPPPSDPSASGPAPSAPPDEYL
jgi:translin